MQFATGAQYAGQWKRGKRSGKGTFSYVNGNRYFGHWKKNQRNGTGTLFSKNGDKYVGNWLDNKRNGHGVLTFAQGAKYTGTWYDGKKSGGGTLLYKNGDKYNGELRKLKKHGRGKMTYADGSVYIGDWKEDIRKGQGKLRPNNKHLIPMEGIWNDNKCTSTLTCDIVFDFNTSDYDFVLKGRNGKRVSSSQLGSSQKKRAMEKLSSCILRENTVEENATNGTIMNVLVEKTAVVDSAGTLHGYDIKGGDGFYQFASSTATVDLDTTGTTGLLRFTILKSAINNVSM